MSAISPADRSAPYVPSNEDMWKMLKKLDRKLVKQDRMIKKLTREAVTDSPWVGYYCKDCKRGGLGLQGPRYRCTVCHHKVDLCAKCLKKSEVHQRHAVLRIKHNGQYQGAEGMSDDDDEPIVQKLPEGSESD